MKITKEIRAYIEQQKLKRQKFMKKIGKKGGLATKKSGVDYRALARKRWGKKLSTKSVDKQS